jgi:G3E family GTPase
LQHRLLVYLTFQAKNLYRMKGLIWLEGKDEQFLLQAVGKRFVIEEKRTWRADENKESKIVFIGKNIQKEPLEKMLSQCFAKLISN